MQKPCGSWSSPISSVEVVQGALRLSAPRIDRGRLFWLEGRPEEGGRQVVMVAALPGGDGVARTGAPQEASPPGVNVRTRVHEYGGGEFSVWRDDLFFVDDADRRLYRAPIGGPAEPLVPEGSAYADLVISPDGRWLFAVEERPREGQEPENRLVAVRLAEGGGGREPLVVASGHDFYASLTVSPRGDRLAFLAWDHPDMPWNGTVLETLEWGDAGPTGMPHTRAGSRTESLFQPRFGKDGTLFVVTDRSGSWNLARLGEDGLVPMHRDDFEVGRAQWVFGMSSWAMLEAAGSPDGASSRALAAATRDGLDALVEIDLENGHSRLRSSDFCSIAGLVTGEGFAACIGGKTTGGAGLYLWRTDPPAEFSPTCIRESSPLAIPPDVVSVAVPRSFETPSGRTVHAFVYSPRSGAQSPRAGERPPLLIKSHGGPTASASAALDPRIQYFTSRGFAVADVNYGGSTGFGRAYRDQLQGEWGVVDVEDCVAVAQAMAATGEVDGDRLAISGGSAGGYTTLCALTFFDVFSAGASYYGIGDLEALARDTHKFESRYTDWLVGPYPEMKERYVRRSPVHHVDRLACPVVFFQGLEDRVVPPSQAEAMVRVLAERGLPYAYVPFEGEQHGFRRAENIRTALDGELYFYSRVFGFDAPRPPAVEVVEPAQ